MQQSPEEETPFVYVTLATFVTLATAGYTPCLFGYVTIGLARHNRTHFSQSERLLVKPKRPCTDLCAESVGVWNRLLSAASEKSREFPAFSTGRGNAFCLRHVGDARHVGDGGYSPCSFGYVTMWVGASQSDAHQPIRTSVSETKEAVYRPMRIVQVQILYCLIYMTRRASRFMQ